MSKQATSYPPAPIAPGSLEILGMPVHGGGAAAIKDFMLGVMRRGERAVILYLNVHSANLAHRYTWLARYFRQAQMVICDGDGIRWGLAILGKHPPPKVTYNIWLWDLCAWCREHDHSLFLLGSKPGVAIRAQARIEERLPGIRIVGTHHGYFVKTGPQNEHVISEISRLRPDIVLVCYGSPVQEEWLRDHAHRMPVHVFLTGGAAIDYGAGEVAVVPPWMRKIHMEWLYRLWLEPVRLFSRYVLGNPAFLIRVIASRMMRGKMQ